MGLHGSDKLIEFLNNCRKIVIVGIGNPLSPIDRIGVEVCNFITESAPDLSVEIALNTPENVLSKYLNSNYTHILVIDAIDAGLPVGDLVFLRPEEVSSETLTTHTIPINLMLKALESEDKRTLILGIQIPTNRGFNEEDLQMIFSSVRRVLNIILEKCE